jgi:hypothetical protein
MYYSLNLFTNFAVKKIANNPNNTHLLHKNIIFYEILSFDCRNHWQYATCKAQ